MFSGTGLPASCNGNAFTCEPTGSLIHREVLIPQAGTFTTTGTQSATHEFLASADPWFRPVNMAAGPDGALYVVDMYRAVIEHPQWMPEELRTRRDLRWGDQQGRIYRISKADEPPHALAAFPQSNAAELSAALGSDNGWTRNTASRLIFERWQTAAEPELAGAVSALLGHPLPETRAASAFLLAAHNALSAEAAMRLMNDSDVRVVGVGIRCSHQLLDVDAIRQQVLVLATSGNSSVRFEVARMLGNFPAGESATIYPALAAIAIQDHADPFTRLAILSSTSEPLALYDAVIARNADRGHSFLIALCEGLGRRRRKEELAGLLERLANTGPENGWALPLLVGLGDGLGGSLEPGLKACSNRVASRIGEVFRWEREIAIDRQVPVEQRVEAVQIVGLAKREFAVPPLLHLLQDDTPQVQRAAIAAVGRIRGDARIADGLLEAFSAFNETARSLALDMLLAERSRAGAVLDAVARGQLTPVDLGTRRIDLLLRHPDDATRDQAERLFAPAADRQAVIEQYSQHLKGSANPQNGQTLFEKNCAMCHRIGTTGTQVGPDIADSRTRTPKALLTDILDPNRAIDGNFIAYTVMLVDGTLQTGLLVDETEATLQLKQSGGKIVSLAKSEIEETRRSTISLMPVGLERTLSPTQMADLVSFIKNWRYLNGDVPLDAEQMRLDR